MNLYAFWKHHDGGMTTYLHGEVISIDHRPESHITVRGYEGYSFVPILLLPLEAGRAIGRAIDDVKRETREAINAAREQGEQRIRDLLTPVPSRPPKPHICEIANAEVVDGIASARRIQVHADNDFIARIEDALTEAFNARDFAALASIEDTGKRIAEAAWTGLALHTSGHKALLASARAALQRHAPQLLVNEEAKQLDDIRYRLMGNTPCNNVSTYVDTTVTDLQAQVAQLTADLACAREEAEGYRTVAVDSGECYADECVLPWEMPDND